MKNYVFRKLKSHFYHRKLHMKKQNVDNVIDLEKPLSFSHYPYIKGHNKLL